MRNMHKLAASKQPRDGKAAIRRVRASAALDVPAAAAKLPAAQPCGTVDSSGPHRVVVEVPIKAISVMNAREHWSVKAKRAKVHRECAHWSLKGKAPLLPCTVTLTRIAPRELDGDNLQASLKACRDGVADWLGVDDRDPRVTWAYAQRKGKPKTYSVEVQIQ